MLKVRVLAVVLREALPLPVDVKERVGLSTKPVDEALAVLVVIDVAEELMLPSERVAPGAAEVSLRVRPPVAEPEAVMAELLSVTE